MQNKGQRETSARATFPFRFGIVSKLTERDIGAELFMGDS